MKNTAPAKGKRADQHHGVYSLKAKLAQQGLAALDGRTKLARELRSWTDAVYADLGGDLSTAEATLLELAARQLALVRYIDSILDANPDWLVDDEKRQLHRIVEQRQSSVNQLVVLLDKLGLKRRAREVKSWRELTAESTS